MIRLRATYQPTVIRKLSGLTHSFTLSPNNEWVQGAIKCGIINIVKKSCQLFFAFHPTPLHLGNRVEEGRVKGSLPFENGGQDYLLSDQVPSPFCNGRRRFLLH